MVRSDLTSDEKTVESVLSALKFIHSAGLRSSSRSRRLRFLHQMKCARLRGAMYAPTHPPRISVLKSGAVVHIPCTGRLMVTLVVCQSRKRRSERFLWVARGTNIASCNCNSREGGFSFCRCGCVYDSIDASATGGTVPILSRGFILSGGGTAGLAWRTYM